ncbi:MAG TPA: glycoside hydrolase [Lentisphaeria bacterium]|nr:glycoside hydrolase [Lentisphaeria bacterium]
MRSSGSDDRFIWTTGSWLIYEYLEQASPRTRRKMEEAIAAGDIRWHALLFTSHSEYMDARMFRFGLSLSRTMDTRYGKKTIAAKMTDVPGHTRAIIPLLSEAGVKFLHIGVNPASKPPDVPDLFRWRCPETGKEVIVMYHKSSYGAVSLVKGLDEAVAFAHTGDNNGPQSAEQIREQLSNLRREFPNAEVNSSTLDDYAAKLEHVRSTLPVVQSEIGDTWIHGTGSDPVKTSRFRALCRLFAKHDSNRKSAGIISQARRCILPVPEHTWGLDIKCHLADYFNYDRKKFEAARRHDKVRPDVPAKYAWTMVYRKGHGMDQRYSKVERSWEEQRGYVGKGLKVLKKSPLRKETEELLNELKAVKPGIRHMEKLSIPYELEIGSWNVGIDRRNGSLVKLSNSGSGTSLAKKGNPIGLLSYQIFGGADYRRYLKQYGVNMKAHWNWAIPDLTKPGMENTKVRRRTFMPSLKGAWSDGASIALLLELPLETRRQYGAPEEIWLEYSFRENGIDARISWKDKPASRITEAFWFSFNPPVSDTESWCLLKMGRQVSPLEIVSNGQRNLHGVNPGILFKEGKQEVRINSLDAALVAPGRPRILEFDGSQPDMKGGMHFCLYNNMYPTNFPLWFEGDAVFRFEIRS